jgi:murein peptide amidase A
MKNLKQSGWMTVLTKKSREGREVSFYLSGSGNPGMIDTLILGVFHGDEQEAAILASAFLDQFDGSVFPLKRVGLVPVVNPDGLAKNQRVNANGVDLNRNFPTRDWAELNPDTLYYSGPQAASEAETQLICQILETYPPQKIITLHTPYQVINFDGPARMLAEAMALANGYPVVADIGYATPGSFGTYAGKERNIPTITLELVEGEAFDDIALKQNLEALNNAIGFDCSHAD